MPLSPIFARSPLSSPLTPLTERSSHSEGITPSPVSVRTASLFSNAFQGRRRTLTPLSPLTLTSPVSPGPVVPTTSPVISPIPVENCLSPTERLPKKKEDLSSAMKIDKETELFLRQFGVTPDRNEPPVASAIIPNQDQEIVLSRQAPLFSPNSETLGVQGSRFLKQFGTIVSERTPLTPSIIPEE